MTAQTFRWAIQPYKRPFLTPLKTSHGVWSVREGLFVLLESQQSGEVGIGEVCPLPWFGTETLEEAIALSQTFSKNITVQAVHDISSKFPASQFGWGTALEALLRPKSELVQVASHQICGLLPAGERVLEAWPNLWQQGHRTFKWKVGVNSVDDELVLFRRLMSALPKDAKVRLDANGGLTMREAIAWLKACDSHGQQMEFIEQPLAPQQFSELQQLAQDFATPIALDESVASLADIQMCHQKEWPGLYVCKLAIMGFPWAIRNALANISNPKIFSSVFEAAPGRDAALALASELGITNALGFGVDHWLAESPKVSINSSTFS